MKLQSWEEKLLRLRGVICRRAQEEDGLGLAALADADRSVFRLKAF